MVSWKQATTSSLPVLAQGSFGTPFIAVISAGLQRLPWLIGQEIDLPATVRMDVMLTVLWHIWKARNTLIFNKENNTAASIIRDVARDLGSWACRFRRAKSHIAAWQTYVQERLPHPPSCNLSPGMPGCKVYARAVSHSSLD